MRNNGFFVAGLGSSAGGLDALRQFFESVDPQSSAAFVVVSHLPIDHSTQLHNILSGVTNMPAQLIVENTALQPNRIYVMPGNLRVKMLHDVLIVRKRKRDEIKNTAIDEFLVSLAADKKEKAVAIIFSGLSDDGSEGVKAVHDAGGLVLVQKPSTALYGVMPVAAINADHPEEVLSPEELGKIFTECIRERSVNR